MSDLRENAIEFYSNAEIATVTLSQGRYISKVRKLAEEYPSEVQIVHENEDGTILAHIPVSYIKISKPREVSEEKKGELSERLKMMREKKSNFKTQNE